MGILIPPSRRTFVIVRPRALPWDLLLCRAADNLGFRELAHDEASAAAQSLFRALREWATGGPGSCEVVSAEGGSYVPYVMVGPFPLAVCRRIAGQPYAVLRGTQDEMNQVVGRLASVLCPPEGVEQEVYFNMRFFERPTTSS
jgi:hypothetical protein